jgi:hypothetical protein
VSRRRKVLGHGTVNKNRKIQEGKKVSLLEEPETKKGVRVPLPPHGVKEQTM